ncbi:MAG TPA: hypothetical protein VK464_28235 [Symbiobacteriaceae bacterium]|nr:hypothetical protein [Symbiobacteriaceae bacterium]
MTLQEVAAELAQRFEAEVLPSDNPYEMTVQGKGYHFVVAPFFGGWQSTLHLPEHPAVTYYAEAVEMLELRMKAKITGRDDKF